MRKFKNILIIFAVLFLSGCSLITGYDEPMFFSAKAVGRQLTFSWEVNPDVDHYILTTTTKMKNGKKQAWYDYVTTHQEAMSGKLEMLENSNLLYDTEYRFVLIPVTSNNIQGPKSEVVKVILYSFDTYRTKLYLPKQYVSVAEDGKVKLEWDNLVHYESSYEIGGSPYSYGAKGIKYKVLRREGTYTNVVGLKTFTASEPYSVIADDITPQINDFQESHLSFEDGSIEAGKNYQYAILPYNDYNWESAAYINTGSNGIDVKFVIVTE